MFRSSDPTQDLRLDILELKKELATSRENNQLLKVKIRKLENEISKRDRQIEILLDPRKSSFVRKVISEKGASMLINLRERNLKLEKTLIEKESFIKRLQNDMQTKKLYTVKSADRKKHLSKHVDGHRCNINIPYYEQNRSSDSEKEDDIKSFEHCLKSVSVNDVSQGMEKLCFRTTAPRSVRSTSAKRAVSADRAHEKFNNKNQISCTTDMKAQYEGLSRDHLLSIIESLKNNQQSLSPCIRKGGSPESDLERNELLCDTPHQEIQQLQNYFLDMLSEVDQLKTTITSLKSEQDKTVSLLREKDDNITHLAKEIKKLKKPRLEAKNIAPLRMKQSLSNSPHLAIYKKRASNSNFILGKRQTQVESKTAHEKKTEEEKEISTCTYTEVEELEQEKPSVQIIQTRTISIQKFDDLFNHHCYDTKTHMQLDPTSDTNIPDHNEEETRKEKFNTLMEQMLQKKASAKCLTAVAEQEDSDLETEYI